MFEDLALGYLGLLDEQMRAISYGFVIVGGVIGGLTNKSVEEIRRAPYFALSCMIFLGMAVVSSSLMTALVPALVGGFFWILLGIEHLASVIAGFFLARIAAARSRDASGHGKMTALAFIPFANLFLLFTGSKTEASVNRTPTVPLLTGGLGVLFGLALLAAGVALLSISTAESRRSMQAANAAGVWTKATLEKDLTAIAAEIRSPSQIADGVTLQRAEAKGHELRYIFETDIPMDLLPADVGFAVRQEACTDDTVSRLITAGATIQYSYLRRDGSEIGTIEITQQACALAEEAAAGVVDERATLNQTLVAMAAEVRTPMLVDDVTTLVRMEADGPELSYVYVIEPATASLPSEIRTGLIQQNCNYEGLTGVIDAGAIVRHVYMTGDGWKIGEVEVNQKVCGR